MSDLGERPEPAEETPAAEPEVSTEKISPQLLRGIEYAWMGAKMELDWRGVQEPAPHGLFIVCYFKGDTDSQSRFVMSAGRFKTHDELWDDKAEEGGKIVAAGCFDEKRVVEKDWKYIGKRYEIITDRMARPYITAFLNQNYDIINRYW